MDLSEEWKSMWPISSVFSAPLLLSNGRGRGGDGRGESPSESEATTVVGPLIFNPSPETITLLFSSPSLSLLPPTFPHLSLPRFLSTTPSPDDPVSLHPSTSSSVATSLGPQLPDHSSAFRHNRLQLLRCPGRNSVLVFFPMGDNSDQVGFMFLSVDNSKLHAKRGDMGVLFTAENKLINQILRLLVNPVPHFCAGSGNTSVSTIGYLMACTMYSVHWYSVGIRGLDSESEKPQLNFLGSNLFKSGSVVHACWSPHLPEESVVLLESGDLFLFDLDSRSATQSSNARFKGKRLRVGWKISASLGKGGSWLSCEFSWHPRIMTVTHSSAVFLVDLRPGERNITCLLKIDTLTLSFSMQNDRFVAFSKASSDGFQFVVASDHRLFLCDVRKPNMPLLQWAHDLHSPSHITVLPLSELRAHPKEDSYKWDSELHNCIIMGSFWNCEFSVFSYGPPPRGTSTSEISRLCKLFCTWELPSELSLSGHSCNCGSCLVREEFSRDALPEWIDWRHRKEIVLGFGILDKEFHAELSEADEFGGFTLIRLMSSGKLESQRYYASWENVKVLEEAHKVSSVRFEDSLSHDMGDGDYKFPKRFKYIKLDWLSGYMKGNLAKLLSTQMKKPSRDPQEKDSFAADLHQCICENMKACGFRRLSPSPAVSEVLKDIPLLTSIHEVALRRIWTGLPMDLLQLAFPSYSNVLEILVDQKRRRKPKDAGKPKVSLEFLDIPTLPQLPPFVLRTPSSRSSKWSQKVQPGKALVGPTLPTPFLITLHKQSMEEVEVLSANAELINQCNEVIQVVREMAGCDHDYVVSLADDRDEISCDTQKPNLLSLHQPTAFSCKYSPKDHILERFATFISKTPENQRIPKIKKKMVEPDPFNFVSPLELKFQDRTVNFESKEMKLLNRQYSKFLEGFCMYQDFLESCNCQKQDRISLLSGVFRCTKLT